VGSSSLSSVLDALGTAASLYKGPGQALVQQFIEVLKGRFVGDTQGYLGQLGDGEFASLDWGAQEVAAFDRAPAAKAVPAGRSASGNDTEALAGLEPTALRNASNSSAALQPAVQQPTRLAGQQLGAALCSLPADTGPCRASITRYAYSAEMLRCQTFVWGGCQGNNNNFETLASCLAACAPPTLPPASAPSPRPITVVMTPPAQAATQPSSAAHGLSVALCRAYGMSLAAAWLLAALLW